MAGILLGTTVPFPEVTVSAPTTCRHSAGLVWLALACVAATVSSFCAPLHAASAAAPPATHADGASERALKAAILINIAKFVTWPSEALGPSADMTICVADADPIGDALAELVRGRTIDGHRLAVAREAGTDDTRGCHLLYLPGADRTRTLRALAAVRDLPIVTVSDAAWFADDGGVVRVYVLDGKMHLDVNVDAAHRAGIQISSQVLRLARVVRGQTTW